MAHNACIWMISSRTKCLPKCLRSIYKHYNYKYNYPVYVYYFDDIYDSAAYRSKIHNEISKNIHFKSVPYKTPGHIKGKLFYQRRDLWYVKKKFSIRRKGYLHMCHFKSNFYDNVELHKYDYAMCFDDEAGYTRQLPYDPVDVMSKRQDDMGALFVGQRLKNGKPHQGHLDTRTNLWRFTKKFLIKNKITPKSELLQKLLVDPDAEWNFHFLPWADTYVMKLKMLETELWKKWIAAVNRNGGIYKYRWGDNEVISLFYLIYSKDFIYNLRAVEKGYLNQGLFRKIQNMAPSIKKVNR